MHVCDVQCMHLCLRVVYKYVFMSIYVCGEGRGGRETDDFVLIKLLLIV
jgi:hypothetical protein